LAGPPSIRRHRSSPPADACGYFEIAACPSHRCLFRLTRHLPRSGKLAHQIGAPSSRLRRRPLLETRRRSSSARLRRRGGPQDRTITVNRLAQVAEIAGPIRRCPRRTRGTRRALAGLLERIFLKRVVGEIVELAGYHV